MNFLNSFNNLILNEVMYKMKKESVSYYKKKPNYCKRLLLACSQLVLELFRGQMSIVPRFAETKSKAQLIPALFWLSVIR